VLSPAGKVVFAAVTASVAATGIGVGATGVLVAQGFSPVSRGAIAQTQSPTAPGTPLRQLMLAAEDGRAATEAERAPLLQGIHSADAAIRRVAVRALGRLEQPALAITIESLIADPLPRVRAEAANALGQAIVGSPERAGEASRRLLEQLKAEGDPIVRGAICETLGRLPYSAPADIQAIEAALAEASWLGRVAPSVARQAPFEPSSALSPGRDSHDAPLPTLTGSLKGLESLFRLRRKLVVPSPGTLERLRNLALGASPSGERVEGTSAPVRSLPASPEQARVRRLALAALLAVGPTDVSLLGEALKDPDEQVRRLAASGVSAADSLDARARALAVMALRDKSAIVRYEGLRVLGSHAAGSCGPVIEAARDTNPHVALLAIDLLGTSCSTATQAPGAAAVDPFILQMLSDSAGELGALQTNAGPLAEDRLPVRTWHRPAHAFVSLAKAGPEWAKPLLPKFAGSPIWQVRMYAARAATTLLASAELERLATDPQTNVREAAVDGLRLVKGHEADTIFVEALSSSDYQLVQTAARALEGSPGRDRVVPALLKSLAALTAERRDTSRDPRRAILERVGELGTSSNTDAITPYLDDFDPRIASLAAEILTGWIGRPVEPATTRAPTGPVPDVKEIDGLTSATAKVRMRSGATFEMRLLTSEAPATVLRFVRLARSLYYDGLTFHRVVPNFVIQGGSPGANEFMGDGTYMRDELGLRPHLRGSVGVSTRGRDTGDAQIFIDLVDNPRLDHDYTVFAEVTKGIETVDAIVEGDVIESIRIISGRGEQP
jgi:cyclophilin family peptidyl-prolyl cis-trans isomerase/HEAT repeat protein